MTASCPISVTMSTDTKGERSSCLHSLHSPAAENSSSPDVRGSLSDRSPRADKVRNGFTRSLDSSTQARLCSWMIWFSPRQRLMKCQPGWFTIGRWNKKRAARIHFLPLAKCDRRLDSVGGVQSLFVSVFFFFPFHTTASQVGVTF